MDIFTTGQWRACGRSLGSLTRAVDDGDARRVLHGVYAWCDVPDTAENRARAIMLVRPQQTVVGRVMAAWLAEVDVLPPGRSVADAGAQSYAESIQRVLFVDAGRPRPTTQIPVYSPTGELLGYLDMGWLRYLLGSEYDGEEHDDEEDRATDERRRGRISTETAWTVDVARKGELWGRPDGLIARTAELLLARGWSPPNTRVLEQISRAQQHEAATGGPWHWLPLDRLFAA